MTFTRASLSRTLRRKSPTIFLIGLAMTLGAFVRFFQVIFVDFPLNDGGMFYTMAQDLIGTHYRLPAYTSYNFMQIPFAYPPLSFYLSGYLSELMHWPLLSLFRLMPATISVLTIPIFYVLARQVLRSKLQAVFATFIFALLPETISWLIYGGGMARAMGLFFAVLALQQAYLMYTRPERLFIVTTGILTALTLLSHPQLGWSVSYSVGVFLLFLNRTRLGLIKALSAAAVVFIFTAPWWLSIIGQHGFAPLLAAFQTGSLTDHQNNLLTLFIGVGFVGQAFWGFLGLVGMVRLIAERNYLLPAWISVIFLLEPRISVVFIATPLAMVGAIAIGQIILPSLERLNPAGKSTGVDGLVARVIFFLFLLGLGITTALNITPPKTSEKDRDAMLWVAQNTASDSQFALVTRHVPWYNDNIGEWFPVLAQRQSVMTVQGTEWLPGFSQRVQDYETLQGCATQDAACLDSWAQQVGKIYSYVLLTVGGSDNYALRMSLIASPNYEIVYDGAGATIFKRKP